MYDGVLILESLKVGTVLDEIPLTVTKVSRVGVEGTSADQPVVWSLVEFAVERGEELAEVLAGVLDAPGWYADFHDEHEIFVIFPGRVFRYRRGDDAARAEAKEFGRGLAIPEAQLDWTR
ncbi:hypothetical protein E0H58_40090 [Kribbella speibonae]|uniref:SPOR domain-containing protein n=1 Tax=Kribbella speibonae TaxID=1572660 RepID=A0ABY1ZXB2_9ACTN|nr:hypothetical protein E0H58_40090 [Kribbella speibonae]